MKNVAQNGKKHCPFVSERGDYKYEDKKPIKAQTACFPNDVINNLSFKNIWSLLVLTTKEWITSETLRIKWQKNRRRSPQHHHLLLQQPQLWHPHRRSSSIIIITMIKIQLEKSLKTLSCTMKMDAKPSPTEEATMLSRGSTWKWRMDIICVVKSFVSGHGLRGEAVTISFQEEAFGII